MHALLFLYFIKNMIFLFICSNEADVDGGDRPSGHDGPSRRNSQPSQKRSKAPQGLESLLHKNISILKCIKVP